MNGCPLQGDHIVWAVHTPQIGCCGVAAAPARSCQSWHTRTVSPVSSVRSITAYWGFSSSPLLPSRSFGFSWFENRCPNISSRSHSRVCRLLFDSYANALRQIFGRCLLRRITCRILLTQPRASLMFVTPTPTRLLDRRFWRPSANRSRVHPVSSISLRHSNHRNLAQHALWHRHQMLSKRRQTGHHINHAASVAGY